MRKIGFDKKFFVKILAGIVICLLAVISYLSYHQKQITEERNSRVSVDSIETSFVRIISELGIQKEWVKKNPPKSKNYTLPENAFLVTVPSDLPIAVIIAELNKQWSKDTVVINAVEKELRGATEIKVSANHIEKMYARFEYDKNLKRQAGTGAIVLTGVEDEKQAVQEKIIQLPEPISFLIVPSKDNLDLVKEFVKNRKEYAVLLNEKIKEPNFKLESGFPKSRLSSSIKDLVGNYKEATCFVLDNNSDLVKPEVFEIIQHEFEKRNIKLILLNRFRVIEGGNDEELNNKFMTGLNSIAAGKINPILLSVSDFNTITLSFQELRRKGFKYVPLSAAAVAE